MRSEKVYIIILNWNGWKDTIECLESVFRINYLNYQVIVCDNASTDGSMDKIKAWANGAVDVPAAETECIQSLTYPSIFKPVGYREYSREQADSGNCAEKDPIPLILIQTGDNLGFAGGNNVGIRFALSRGDCDYIWLLNNDTVVDKDALNALVKRVKEVDDVGMCGSTLLYYKEPWKVQALGGGSYNKWLGISKHVGEFSEYDDNIDDNTVESKIDYIVGASMLVPSYFINDVGLLGEDYFLYYEELDWIVRAKGQYRLAYAKKSIVYHKEGASTGSHKETKQRSYLADFYGITNRLAFTEKYFTAFLPCVYLGLFYSLFRRIYKGQWDRAKMIMQIIQGKPTIK